MGTIVAIGLTLAVFLGGIINAVLSRQISEEFKAWMPWIVERLLLRAVARLPQQQERYEEEWRSHLNEVPGDIGKLFAVVGFIRAARNMSRILDAKTERNQLPLRDFHFRERSSRRLKISVEIQLVSNRTAKEVELACTEDISAYGARVLSNRAWELGDLIKIRDSSGHIAMRANVVYCQRLFANWYAVGLKLQDRFNPWHIGPHQWILGPNFLRAMHRMEF